MKFDVWKDIMSQSYYFKSWPDLVTLGGGGSWEGETLYLGKHLEWRDRDEAGWRENKHKS